jgi:hypothetical protein
MVEKIICSAIWYQELPTPVYGPINVDRGIVFCGHRHPHCIHQMHAMTGKNQSQVGDYIQGFLTNTNQFVDRKEGAIIALDSGQIEELQYSKTYLFSEDLY